MTIEILTSRPETQSLVELVPPVAVGPSWLYPRKPRRRRPAHLKVDPAFRESYWTAGQTVGRHLLGIQVGRELRLQQPPDYPQADSHANPPALRNLIIQDEVKRILIAFLAGMIALRRLDGAPVTFRPHSEGYDHAVALARLADPASWKLDGVAAYLQYVWAFATSMIYWESWFWPAVDTAADLIYPQEVEHGSVVDHEPVLDVLAGNIPQPLYSAQPIHRDTLLTLYSNGFIAE